MSAKIHELSTGKKDRMLAIALRALLTVREDYDEHDLDNALHLYIEADSALEQIADIANDPDEDHYV